MAKRPVNCLNADIAPAALWCSARRAPCYAGSRDRVNRGLRPVAWKSLHPLPGDSIGKSRGFHSLFENASAVASGIEAALKNRARKEKIVIMAGWRNL
jgi:hypothetical protein